MLVVACAVGFAGGSFLGAKIRDAEVAEQKRANAEMIAQINAETARKIAEAEDRLQRISKAKDDAFSQLAASRKQNSALASSNRNLTDRLRRSADAYGERVGMSASADNPCRAVERQLAESVRLHAEGAGLLAEAVELVGRLDADRTAARRINEEIAK